MQADRDPGRSDHGHTVSVSLSKSDLGRRATSLLAALLLLLVASSAFARACDYCGLPSLAKHRTGGVIVIVRTDRSTYRAGSDPLLIVTLTNTGTTPVDIDATMPVWKQTSLHVMGPRSGVSYPDVPGGSLRRHRMAPGASFTFPSPGNHGTPLSRWTSPFRGRGTYHLDLTYEHIDGPTIAFTLL